jgi:enterochelin esterase family protein
METLAGGAPPPIIDELAALPAPERLAVLAGQATPIAHGDLATFVHLGPADRVEVRHFMARFPAIAPMRRVVPGLHEVTVRLPDHARVEYKLAIHTGGRLDEFVDPHNPRRATDPFGANSVASGPGYTTPWWTQPTDAPGGEVRRGYVESDAYGQRRVVRWYRPGEADRPVPLLVVHDGGDFTHHAGIVTVLDNLIAAGAVPPLVAALIDSKDRLTEYVDDPRHARFVEEVSDAAVRRHGASPDPADHVYLGASLGAVAALATVWRGRTIGGLVLLSGSFVTALGGPMQRGPRFQPVIDFMERYAADPGRPADRIYQACGEYEGLAPDNRAFTPILESTGAAVVVEGVPDGHHWHNWRNRLGAALCHTVPHSDVTALAEGIHPGAAGTAPGTVRP